MPHEHSIGILTGLVLLVSILVMIGSLDRAARTLRGPVSSLPALNIAHLKP